MATKKTSTDATPIHVVAMSQPAKRRLDGPRRSAANRLCPTHRSEGAGHEKAVPPQTSPASSPARCGVVGCPGPASQRICRREREQPGQDPDTDCDHDAGDDRLWMVEGLEFGLERLHVLAMAMVKPANRIGKNDFRRHHSISTVSASKRPGRSTAARSRLGCGLLPATLPPRQAKSGSESPKSLGQRRRIHRPIAGHR